MRDYDPVVHIPTLPWKSGTGAKGLSHKEQGQGRSGTHTVAATPVHVL